jgi:uncharacterized protein
LQNAKRQDTTFAEASNENYFTIVRACTFSAIALAAVMSMVCLNSAPPFVWFGGLVTAGTIGSLIGVIVIIPSVYGLYYEFTRTTPKRGIL